jgi:hypothetical protein
VRQGRQTGCPRSLPRNGRCRSVNARLSWRSCWCAPVGIVLNEHTNEDGAAVSPARLQAGPRRDRVEAARAACSKRDRIAEKLGTGGDIGAP